MESEILKYVVEGGVGLVAIVVVFLFYRADSAKRDAIWDKHCNRLLEVMREQQVLIKSDQDTRERHTAVMVELATLLRGLNGRVATILTERKGP